MHDKLLKVRPMHMIIRGIGNEKNLVMDFVKILRTKNSPKRDLVILHRTALAITFSLKDRLFLIQFKLLK